ncbi:hypothetical protein Agabi119p4_1970 [Agaricus bisporus var. burnettii]|uniref:C3H1-type domain-containing protein n=1 Tax=Agaricus bisporus var. burnettii TaxID=192524 RepID=A0A8H7KJI9_AGABI|nr:hypothetical protein Agabi119p4_1970 [Agaricus bisporus var. burnettii]
MASHLANIFGTEQDRVNCSFYYKIGACRHGDRCSRKHIKPPFSQTILLPNVYHNPAHDPICKLTEKELQEGFDAVYEDLYCELAKFGHLLELHVCDNKRRRPSIAAMNAGMQGGRCMLSYPLLPTFVRHAVDRMKMGNLRHGQRLERKLHPPQHQGGGGWEPSKRNRSASPPSRRGRDGEDRWSRKRD